MNNGLPDAPPDSSDSIRFKICVLTGRPVSVVGSARDVQLGHADGLQTNIGLVHRDAEAQYQRLLIGDGLERVSVGVRRRLAKSLPCVRLAVRSIQSSQSVDVALS